MSVGYPTRYLKLRVLQLSKGRVPARLGQRRLFKKKTETRDLCFLSVGTRRDKTSFACASHAFSVQVCYDRNGGGGRR